MTVLLRTSDGAPRELDLGGRRELAIGVAMSQDLATVVRRAVHADLLGRVAQRHRAVVSMVAVGEVPAPAAALLSSYNCRPWGDGQPDIVIGVDVRPPYDGEALDLTVDPLVSRLALLGRHADVEAAAGELTRWRAAVAAWAESASKPMCADYVGWCDEALDDNLDAPRLLGLMREVEMHPELPPGSKFETFAHLDSLIALDLARDVGRTLPQPLPPNC